MLTVYLLWLTILQSLYYILLRPITIISAWSVIGLFYAFWSLSFQEEAGLCCYQTPTAALHGLCLHVWGIDGHRGFLHLCNIPLPTTFFTALAGTLLGSRTGAASQAVYVILGCIGLPVFAAGKAGLGVLCGPTGGYLLGFIAGAYVIGKIIEYRKQAGIIYTSLAILVGDIVIYSLGTLQLAVVAHLSPMKALLLGVVPFVIPELIKLLAAAMLTVRLKGTVLKEGISR